MQLEAQHIPNENAVMNYSKRTRKVKTVCADT